MMARSVADVLISFSARETVEVYVDTETAADAGELDRENNAEVRERAIAAAREEGFAEGAAWAAAAHAEALDAERNASATRLAAERDRWASEEGRLLAETLMQGLADIEARITACVARILSGFLAERLIERATRELAQSIRQILAGADGKIVEVTGPADVVAKLSDALAGDSAAVAFHPNASADVRIVCDETLVEARLSPWLARLSPAVE